MHTSPARFAAWIAAGLLGALPVLASEYYVSPGGSDSAPGTLSQPFQTIQQAATVMVAGDTTYILAGVYRETVIPANSGTQSAPITFMPYNGAPVTVSGADVIPAGSWTLSSGNIYKAPMSWDLGAGANQVFLDGRMMIEAQWPNTTLDVSHPTVSLTTTGSYAPTTTSFDNGTVTDVNLPSRPPGYWNGATINICLGACWWWQTGTITDSSTPQQLTFTFQPQSGTDLLPEANNSYFLTGVPGELDSPGEWFYNSGASALSLWAPLGDNPSGHLVEAKTRQLAFDLSSRSFITIQGVGLFAATINTDANSQYLVLDGLQCQYIAQTPIPSQDSIFAGDDAGIALRGANNVLRNSTVAFSSSSGVYMEGTGQRVFNNIIRDTDYRPTYASPIFTGLNTSDQHLIAYNTIYNSGRFGIYHTSNFVAGRILHNEIHDYGLQTNDLGCTYTWMTDGMGTEIAYNLCHDAQGLLLNNSIPYTDGIYLDSGSSNFIVHHNVVWNVESAVQPNAPSTNEQIYNNDFIGAYYSFNAYPNADLPGTVIENNIFVGPLIADPLTGAVVSNNVLPGADPQFVDAANHNYQLLPTSPAIAAGLIIPPYTNGYSGSAPDIGAYDHTKPPWKAGAQNAAAVSAPSYSPTLTPGTVAVVTGSVPFDSGASVVLTDGANVDWPAPLVYVIASPPQLAFQVPSAAAPGVAMITVANADGTISLSSAPLFAGMPPINIASTQGSGQSAPVDTLFPAPLQATVTASGNAVSGAAVTFAAPASGASGSFALSATVTTNGAGVAVAPPFLANAVAGTYTVTASAAGAGTVAMFSLTNTGGPLLSQTISFGPLANQTPGASPPALNATSSSGLAVTFTSNTPSVCTVSGVNITLLAVGTCSIMASQDGNGTYAPAIPVIQTFMVSGTVAQTIAFGPLGNVNVYVDPFTVSATAGSGLAVIFTSTIPAVCTVLGNTVTILSTGTCSITASQSGNSTYAPAPSVTQSFIVSEPLVITVGPDLGVYPIGDTQIALAASGGLPPYTWSLTEGALPPGTAIRTDIPSYFQSSASAGIIGVTVGPGTASFTLTVTDAAANTATRALTVEVLSLFPVDVYPLPDAFTGISYSATLQALGSTGAVSWSVPSFSALPTELSLIGATIFGVPTAPGSYSFNVAATDSTGSVFGGYNLNVYGPGFSGSSALGNVTIGTALASPIALAGKGGTPPYTFQGSAPPGLSLSSSGTITGTPAGNNATNTFNVTITDNAGLSYTKTFAINYTGAPGQPNLPNLNYPVPFQDFTVGGPQSWSLQVYGGTQPYTWSATGLPAGLSLQTTNLPSYLADIDAEIIGAAPAAGNYDVTVSVTDSSSPAITIQQPLTLAVSALGADYPSSSATRGAPYSFDFRALGGSAEYTWQLIAGSLPAGLTLDSSTGLITGTPLENGSFYPAFLITSTTASGSLQLTRSIGITVNSPASPQISMPGYSSPPDVMVNSSYNWQLQFCCAAGSLTYSITAGALPKGLTLDPSTGIISGTPSVAGLYPFTVQATDSANTANFGVRVFTLNVSPIQPSTPLPDGSLGAGYFTIFTATGGMGPYSWALAPGSALLPDGITLSSTGVLSGTLLTEGVFNFSYIVSDSASHTWHGYGTLRIFPPLPAQTISFGPLSNVTFGAGPLTVTATASSGLIVSFVSTTTSVCTVAGTTVTIVAGGVCSITATQAGDASYGEAPAVTQTFTVSALPQMIAFGPLTDQTLGSSPPPLSATATSGLAVTFASNSPTVCAVSGVNITLVTEGICSITASQPGNSNYTAAAPVTQIFTVSVAGIQSVAAFLDQNGAPALTFNGSTGFPDAGGFLIGAPGVTEDLYGNTYVVGLDAAGGVHLNSYTFANSTWNGWQYSGGILDTSSGLSAAVDPTGIVWFTGRDIGNRFWINSWNGTSFGGWILVADGIFASDSIPQIAIPFDGSIYVVGKDIGGRIWSNSYIPSSQTFTGWVDRQAVMIGQPSATAGQDGMVYVAVRSVPTNSPVYITQIPAQNAATPNTWLNGGGLIDTDPQITSQGGTVYLTALAGEGTVYLLTFAESTQTWGTWSFTNGTLNDETIAAAAGSVFIAGRDGSDRIYWYSVTGNNWFFAGGAGMSSTVLTGGK